MCRAKMFAQVNLSRVPRHLHSEIFLKQSGMTMIKLMTACQQTNKTVEGVLSRTPGLCFLISTFNKYEMAELLPGGHLCLPRPEMPLKGLVHICISEIKICHTPGTLDPEFCQEMLEIAMPFSMEALWQEQNRRGPRQIELERIPRVLVNTILFKATLRSLFRLARTSTTGKRLSDECLNSTVVTALAKRIIDRNTSTDLAETIPRGKAFKDSSKNMLRKFLRTLIYNYKPLPIILKKEEVALIVRIAPYYSHDEEQKRWTKWKTLGYSYYSWMFDYYVNP